MPVSRRPFQQEGCLVELFPVQLEGSQAEKSELEPH